MAKAFASSADLAEKVETLEILADGVYALTAEGDPNVGAIEGEDFLVCIEARATPAAARDWLGKLREHTDKPVKYLVLTHYHAVRVLGASAFEAEHIIASETTRKLIEERGKQDWDSEFGRMPRLFKQPEEISGLTWPTQTFTDHTRIDLGGIGATSICNSADAAIPRVTSSSGTTKAKPCSQAISSRRKPRFTRETPSISTGRPPRWTRSRHFAPRTLSAGAARWPGVWWRPTRRSNKRAISSNP